MRHPQRKAVFRQPRRLFGGLSRRREQKIRRDILEASCLCHRHRRFALRCGVAASQQTQHLILAVLQAKGDAVKARFPQFFQQLRRHGSRVRFHRDFDIRRHRPSAAYRLQHSDKPYPQQRRRPSAKVDSLYFMALQWGGFHCLHQCRGVRLPQG